MRNSFFWGSWNIFIYSSGVRTCGIKTLPSEQHFEYWGLRVEPPVLSSTQKMAPQKTHSWLMRPRISLCTLGFANGAWLSRNPTGRATWMPSSRVILARRSTFRVVFARQLCSRCSTVSNVRNCACCSTFAKRLASRASFESLARALECWRAFVALWSVTHSSEAAARRSRRLAATSVLVSSVVRALRRSAAASLLSSSFA